MRKKNQKSENFIFTVALVVLMGIIMLTFLVGCKTRERVVTETIITHDTIMAHHTDTLRDVRVLHVHDTLRLVESHELTLGASGDTIKEVHHYHDVLRTVVVDSTDRYKAESDSLQQKQKKEKSKEKSVVDKKFPKWFWMVTIANFLLLFLLLRRLLLPLLKKRE